jgi:exosortase
MANDYLSPASPIGAMSQSEPVRFSWTDSFQRYSYFALVGLTALLTYSFWNTLEKTSAFWSDDQYSHGYLVPLIALYLMWSRRPNPAAQDPPEEQAEETFLGLMPASQFRNIACGAASALTIGGYYLGSHVMQGVGLALLCLLAMSYVLIGQPFASVTSDQRYIGLAILLAGYVLRIYTMYVWNSEPGSRISFIIVLLGGFLLVGGWKLLSWAGPAVGFLVFMFPLPSKIEQPLLGGLQKFAAVVSEIILLILGQPVVRDGNLIQVDGQDLEVAAACSGLRMVTIFGAMAVALMLIARDRPWWDRFIILLSALPIALIANITRIVVTALLYRIFPEGDTIHQLIHDYAGIAMMPLAMGLLLLELKVLSMLTVEEESLDLGHSGAGIGAAPIAR